jgi:hypothetical protein
MNNWSILAITPALAIVVSSDVQVYIQALIEQTHPLVVGYILLASMLLTTVAHVACFYQQRKHEREM